MSDVQPKAVEEFPKWVEPHRSHIETNAAGHQVPQGFADFHLDRVSRKWSVLVSDVAEETRAIAEKPKAEEPVVAAEEAPADPAPIVTA